MKQLSVFEFIKKFDTEQSCHEYLKGIRWRDGLSCHYCGSKNVYITNRGYRCANTKCRLKFTNITGTLFQNTKIPLREWFLLIYSMASNKKNISSIQNGKNIGVTQKTSWGMMLKIRDCLKEHKTIKLSGIVEVDEAFVSKGNQWTRWGGISTRKAPIIGLIERGGKVVIRLIDDRKRETIKDIIQQHVEPGSTIYTDGWAGYKKLPDFYNHDYVEHSTKEYVRGDVHTNTIENVWSLLKKAIRNAHHSVSNKHLEGYANEIAFRLNYRDLTTEERFDEILFRAANYKPKILSDFIKQEDNDSNKTT